MQRLARAASVTATASVGLAGHHPCGASSSSSSPFPRSPLLVQRRGIRNLHQYPHARYKSLVKDNRRFARNWWLTGGNNYELVSEVGHEREATENFSTLRDDSDNDAFVLSTNKLEDLPPAERLNTLVELMRVRWKVRDNNRGFDKAKLMLKALECFSEMRQLEQIKAFHELPEPDQDTFLQYVEGCVKYAQACSHSHPDAVAVVLRAAEICDEMRCTDKREELIHISEEMAKRLDRAYASARPYATKAQLLPTPISEVHSQLRMKQVKALEEHFKDNPAVVEKTKPREFFRGPRSRKIYHDPMRHNDVHRHLLAIPHRPETRSWNA
ncbi:hypothetical protein ABB37_03990 [Leptomonas pyrrhocoris]|uniref:Uncharacterized protein n=1 Tax=Leptomonas pyrrhocoris TaxID=157538 RepID=A0A0N0VFM6_LEPPY|nr:hypothetical protein ABB37_03990 [Leptomonas pyrrhocoris]KPA81682.1 hypothetical protein ABB37_03990 [Leptomonas pyrrhocoris]|eukprot:XP_015660121.1 hypothetical protein ABB37_03990 [Leptomonas pyrrhocoris]